MSDEQPILINSDRFRRLAEEPAEQTPDEMRTFYKEISKLDDYFALSLDLLCIANAQGYFIRLNPEWERVLGYSLADLEGHTFFDFIHPDDLESSRLAMDKLKAQEQVLRFENRYRCKDGSYRWIEWRSHPQDDLIYAAARDVTERKQTEMALRESESRYRTLFESLPVPAFTKNRAGQYTSNNAENMRYWTVNPLGLTDADLLPPERAAALRENDYSVMETGQVLVLEETLPSPEGEHYFLSHKAPLYNSDGNVIGVLGVSLDITERKRATELALQQSAQLRVLYEAGQRLSRTLDPAEIYHTICNFIVVIAPNDGFFISSFDQATQLITCRAYWMDNYWLDVSAFPPIPLEAEGHGTQSVVIRTGQPLIISDYPAWLENTRTGYYVDSQTNKILTEIPSDEEDVPRSALIVPLKLGGKVTGVMQVMSRTLNAYTENQLNLLESLSLHLASAEQNALLYTQLQQELAERERAEAALRESEALYQSLVAVSPMAICRKDLNGRFTFANRRFLEASDLSLGDLIGKTDFDLHPPELAQKYRTDDMSVMESGKAREFVEERAVLDGGTTVIQSYKTPIYDAAGNLTGVQISFWDITERNRAERALAAEKERLAVTLRSIGDGVITTDIQGNVAIMNKVSEELTGWTQAEAVGKPLGAVFSIIDEQTRRPRPNIAAQVLAQGEIIELANHTVLVSHDGSERIIADSAAPIKDNTDKTIGVVLVFRDMTEKLKLQEVIQRTAKLDSVGILAGGIAHDFNNLLTGLFGNIEMAKMFLPAEHKSYRFLETAGTSMENATNLTKQLLIFAKGGDPVKEVISIGKIIVETAQFSMRGSNVKLHSRIAPDLWPVDADKGQLSQVISNLVINAQQAMPDGGTITITAANVENSTSRYVEIVVQDEGLGIPPQHLDKIFDPYFSTKQKGSGLGLTSTHSIISKHNGTITVDSKLNHGTVFTIRLPAAKISAPTATGSVVGQSVPPAVPVPAARILVMDDDEMICDLLGAILDSLGYQVDYAADGREAVEKYGYAYRSGGAFNAVIVDLTIPGGMGGKAAAQEILKLDPQARIIVSSGYATDPVLANYETYGFKARVAKPYTVANLQAVIEQVLAGDSP